MDDERLGIPLDTDEHAIVIDMCSVNVAKQMHVGHLRSTIIGDALARVLERQGRTVHRENHLGDWGLPIARVLHELRERDVDLESLTLDGLGPSSRSRTPARTPRSRRRRPRSSVSSRVTPSSTATGTGSSTAPSAPWTRRSRC